MAAWQASFETLTVTPRPRPGGPMTRGRLEDVIRAELSGLRPRNCCRGLGDRAAVILAAADAYAAYLTQQEDE